MGCMLRKKAKKTSRETSDATRASVRKEMARPRMAKSARIRQRNLDTIRTTERPSTAMPGTVNKIIPSPHPRQPEKAEIVVDGTARQHRNLRIENSLADQHGDEARLKKGAHVEVTVAAEAKTPSGKSKKGS
jgi:hypothetical protein